MTQTRFELRRLSLTSLTWYTSVPAGWALIGLATWHVATAPRIGLVSAFAMTAVLGVVLELLPLVRGRGHDPQGVVMSSAFVAALMFVWGPWPPIVVVALGSLSADRRRRKDLGRSLFNPAQYALSFAAGWLAIRAFGASASLDRPLTAFHPDQLPWMLAAAVAFFVVNITLVGAVLSDDGGFVVQFFDDFWHNTITTFAVLSLAPLVVVVALNAWELLPVLLIPLLLLYSTARLALAREHEAGHDALTGLRNRASLQLDLADALESHARDNASFALMLIDLDDFKQVNDTLGHVVGDQLLVRFAARLRDSVRPDDLVARLGGDEFAVLVRDVDLAAAQEIADRVRSCVQEPFAMDGMSLEANLSLGVAMYPQHGDDVTTLMSRADIAMYLAKNRSKGVEVYSHDGDETSVDRLGLLGELRQALADDAITLHYQPKLSLHTMRPCGVEALVRWQHPVRGFLPPDEFIPVAERSGVMPILTARVIRLAVAQAVRWRDMGLDVPVAVNISAMDLTGPALEDVVQRTLAEFDAAPGLLLLEITERIAATQVDETMRALTRLRDLGVRVSLDDFGTGYSSLQRLSALRVDELKVDRVFTASMLGTEFGRGIVQALVDLGHALRLPVVVEGVETAAQWQALVDLGCDAVQGHHVAEPMTADGTTAWVRAQLEVTPLSLDQAPSPAAAGEVDGATLVG